MKIYNVAAAIVRRGDEVVLVQQSSPEVEDKSFWTLPSGKLEEGETFLDAALREVKEETGLEAVGKADLVYICEYKNAKEGYSCRVEMYAFPSFSGVISPDDPDNSIEDAMFFSKTEAIEKLSKLKWPMVKEPATAYLTDPNNKPLHWVYEADNNGEYKLVSQERIPSAATPPFTQKKTRRNEL